MRRALKAVGLILVGAVLASAGFFGWYEWGRSTGPTTIPITYAQNSGRGMGPQTCQVNAAGTEALAYGAFTKSASYDQNGDIALYVVGAHQKLLGHDYDNEQYTRNPGGDWTLQANLLQGFGPAVACYVSIG
jgi:hypothetical protein